jgi:hypothetical protein
MPLPRSSRCWRPARSSIAPTSSFEDLYELVGFSELQRLEQRYVAK